MRNRKNEKRINKIAKEVVKIKKSLAKSIREDDENNSLEAKIMKSVGIIPSPYQIANLYGIKCIFDDLEGGVPSYFSRNNFTIYISNKYCEDDYAARHLIAHELGHFFLHKKSLAEMNNFASKEMEEYEANVFSILLMPQIMGGIKWETLKPKELNEIVYKKVFKKSG